MRQGKDAAAVERLILLKRLGNDRQAHIDPAQERLNLDHLGNLAGRGSEFVKGARVGLVQRDAKRHRDPEPQCPPINGRRPATHDTVLAHLVDPARHPPSGQAKPFGKVWNRHARIGLKVAQDGTRGVVKHKNHDFCVLDELITRIHSHFQSFRDGNARDPQA